MEESIQKIKSHYLYNMLQDFRHLLIFDLRSKESYENRHIRDSFNLIPEKIQQIGHVIELALRKGQDKQQKYSDLKKVRRYFFIDEEPFDNTPQVRPRVNKVLQMIPKDPSNKIYALADSYQTFYENYSFVNFDRNLIQKLKQQEGIQQKDVQNQIDRLLVYPYCRFPSQIIPGKLYLGNIYSSNSEKQLKDIGITNLIDFIDYEAIEQSQRMVPQFKTNSQKYNYLCIPFNKDVPVTIDFDNVNAEIKKTVNEGKTLLYCRDGETISAAMAISLLMYEANLNITMATLKVCQAIGRSDITKWIYTQLLVYKPKK